MTRIFLSYARGDDAEPFNPATSFVARLHRDLTAAGFEVWFDRVSMPSRSLTFHQEIRDAVAACDRLVLIVGPKALESLYVRQEWQFAYFEAEKIVTPILRLGDYPLAIDELKLLHAEDFRDDAQYLRHFDELVRILGEPPKPLGKLIAVPSLPPHFLSRTDRLTALRDALRADLDRPVVITGAAARVGMHGMGGIGKSVLAATLSRDRKIREAFPDGIVWVGLGSLPTVADLQRRVHKDLGGDGAFQTEHEGRVKLRDLLKDKGVLLILDDVWRRADVDWFDVLGPRCRAMITTRDAGLLTSLGGVHHQVELLTDAEAMNLLAQAAGVERDKVPSEAADLIAECGRLPLAVALCGGLIRAGFAWAKVLEQLRNSRIDRINDPHAAKGEHENIWNAIDVSVKFLSADEQARFVELAVFPSDEATPIAALETLWSHTAGFDDWDTDALVIKLLQRSLLELTADDDGKAISLHDLVFDYVHRAASDETELHQRMLEAYRKKCPGGWQTGPWDGYFFQNLLRHLRGAGKGKDALDMLKSFDWLGANVSVGMVYELAIELEVALQTLSHQESSEFKPWYFFIRQNATFLAKHPECFFQQAYNESSTVSTEAQNRWNNLPKHDKADVPSPNRTQPQFDDNELIHLRERVSYLLELIPPLGRVKYPFDLLLPSAFFERITRKDISQATACIATFSGHHWAVNALAICENLQLVVSCDCMGDIKIWDVRSGECRFTYYGNECINSICVSELADTVVSGKSDGQLELFSLENWEIGLSLIAHSDAVTSVAINKDCSLILSGSHDKTAKGWDSKTGICLFTLTGHNAPVNSVAISEDSRVIATGSDDNTIRVWNAQTGACDAILIGHTGSVLSVILSKDGLTVLSGSNDNTIRVWDVKTGLCQRILVGHSNGICSIALNVEGDVISGAKDNTIKYWNLRSGVCRKTFTGHKGAVCGLEFCRCYHWVISGSKDGTIKIWDAKSEHDETLSIGHNGRVLDVLVNDDGSRILSCSDDRSIKIWDVTLSNCRLTLSENESSVNCLSASTNGKTIISGSEGGFIRLWDAETGACVQCIRGHLSSILHFPSSPVLLGDFPNFSPTFPRGAHLLRRDYLSASL